MERGVGGINFYLTQFLTGHGYFRYYLYKMNKVRIPDCAYSGHDKDDEEHTFFLCMRWITDRRRLEDKTGNIIPNSTIIIMLRNEHSWTEVSTFVDTVLRRKKREGHLEYG